MNIKETIAVINQLRADFVIGQYAIGGAVAATFYPIEPTDTQDLDVFIALDSPAGHTIVTLEPIHHYLEARGFETNIRGDVVIAGWPVQFLPVGGNRLIEEALEHSIEMDLDGVPARVFTAEHLAAIAFQLGRPKDKIRVDQFLEAKALDESRFSAILERHGLLRRWLDSRNM